MNITIKITHANGTVVDVNIPIGSEVANVTTSEISENVEVITVPLKEDALVAEEEKQSEPEPEPEPVHEPKPEPEAESVETGEQFRCVDGLYTITPGLYSDFCSAFGAPMVDRELVLARLWLETNPVKRKTRRGISRFLNAWLCRAQGEKRQPIKSRSGSLLDSVNTSQEGW